MKKKTADRPTFDTNRMRTVAIAYYPDEDAWRRMRRVVSDPGGLGENYEAWQARHQAQVARLEQEDAMGIPVALDADEFKTWCQSSGRAADATARSLFAAEKMRG
jgi:hypothetical protein